MQSSSLSVATADGQMLPLVSFNTATQAPLKLTSTNYVAWRFQFRTLLSGYDLYRYVDGTYPCPSSTVLVNTKSESNPLHEQWVRQDQLILSAIIGSISPTLIPFIAAATSSRGAWDTLASIYGKSSRGRILALKNRIHNPVKGTRSVSDFMLDIKGVVDELSLLGVVTDPEDLVLKVLNGLDDSYKEISNAIQARDTPVSFDELLDKLLSTEAQQAARVAATSNHPATAFPASAFTRRPPAAPGRSSYQQYQRGQASSHQSPSKSRFQQAPASSAHQPGRGYQGRCQLCGTHGHSARRCPGIRAYAAPPPSGQPPSPAYSYPSAHTATSVPSPSDWILDSGASHHITTDLGNLSLHAPYGGVDNVIVGDGEGQSYGGRHTSGSAR